MTERSRTSVLLTTEGTYPYQRGEVSTWCEVLTEKAPDVDFTVLAVMPQPFGARECRLAPNVRALMTVPLHDAGGMERPEARQTAPHRRRRWPPTAAGVRTQFVPVYTRFVRESLQSEPDSPALGDSLAALHEHFAGFSYDRTIAHQLVWEAFVDLVSAAWARDMPDEPPPSLGEIAEGWRALGRLLRVVAAPIPQTDLTHASAAGFCALPCVVAKVRRRTPYMLTEHGVYLRDQYLNLGRAIGSYFVRWFLLRVIGAVADVAYAFADQISPVCASHARWEHWRGVGAERIQVIANGVDQARFSPAPPDARRHDRPLVVNVAPLLPQKGQLDLIEATATLREAVPGVEVRCYGDVLDRDYFETCQARVRALGLEGTVLFDRSPADLCGVYRLADVVCGTSLAEGFPRSLVEAMLCGASIVATDVGGVAEALGSSGRLIGPRDPRALAGAVRSLLESGPARRALGRSARARALEHFTEERFVSRYRAAYESISGGGVPAGPRGGADASGVGQRSPAPGDGVGVGVRARRPAGRLPSSIEGS